MSIRSARGRAKHELRIGLVGIAVAVALVIGCGVVYFAPVGNRSVAAEFDNTGGLRTGDEVRVAGIGVGTVTDIALTGTGVRVAMDVGNGVRIGNDTSADIRLLTVVGGHYIALRPAGGSPLGDGVIPQQRTTVPYTLSDVLSDSGEVVKKVEGQTISQTLDQVQQVLSGSPTAIRSIIDDMRTLTTTVGDNRDSLDQALALSEEYLAALNQGRGRLVDLIRLIGYVGAKAYQVKAEGVETIRSIGGIFAFVRKPVEFFTGNIEPSVKKALEILAKLKVTPDRIDQLLKSLRTIIAGIAGALGTPGQSASVDMSTVVIPAPGVSLPSVATPPSAPNRDVCIPSDTRRC